MDLKSKFSGAVEFLKTEAAVATQVIRGKAFVETLIPSKRNRLDIIVTRKDGTVEKLNPVFNSRVDAGALWQAGIMGNATGAASAQYIALTNTAITIAHGDTTLSGEITTNGLGRAIAAYGSYTAPASLNASASYILSKTFTCATAPQACQAAGLFNASSAGSLFVEATFTQVSLQIGDSININWTINI